MTSRLRCMGAMLVALSIGLSPVHAQTGDASEDRDARIEQLERMVEELAEEIRELRAEQEAEKKERAEIREEIDEAVETARAKQAYGVGGLELGGYAEIHANFNQGSDKDQIDIHRFVLEMGYEFEDWIRFRSEIEIEHAFVSDDDGELSLEQFYADFMFNDKVTLRVGRFLTPLGIVNAHHEPPSFNGVERPSVDRVIIPSTWSSDGVGIHGKLVDSLSYELYAAGGLDGSQFDPVGGIRDGRLKERPSLNDIALMGRVDYFPFVSFSAPAGQMLRLGLAGYTGGVNNGDQGSNPGVSGANLTLAAADFDYTVSKFDFRGEAAYTWIDEAAKLPAGVAKELVGWYLESAYHVMPDSWKKGRWSESDTVVFVRYEDFDTQHKTVSGVARVPGGDRQEWTTGLGFYFTPSIVLKADYQILEDDSATEPDNKLNFGLGMQF